MSDVDPYPINFETKGVTGRDGYIVAEALYFASKWIDDMPDKVRPAADQRDIFRILNAAFPDWEDIFGPS